MPFIEFHNISKSFEDSIAIQEISFDLEKGELLTLLGPSGSGKTTVLRLIAGLIEADTGKILFEGKDMFGVPTEDRKIGFVFQSYALFPHLTVVENIAFGLEARKWPKEQIIARVKELLSLVGLEGKGNRYPRELSGGEKSRVALARALAPNPSLLLLDEPLSALDQSLKESLRKAIREIQQEVQISTIYVTHDQKEAMEISDRIIILNLGKIMELGTPEELYLHPKKKFTAEFLGISNIIEGLFSKNNSGVFLQTTFGDIKLPSTTKGKDKKPLTIAIYPEHIHISKDRTNNENEFAAEITSILFGGSLIDIQLKLNEIQLLIQTTSSKEISSMFKKGDKVYFSIPLSAITILEE
ncbi:MAG: ABC transporter ATP-binding protein [Asgard group archaeon]|nr:ABC transporter ATP-binding protein [Asgard group archaeon]